MRSQSLVHDHAMALATAVLDIVSPCLPEEQQREAFGLIYTAAVAAIEHYEAKSDRLTRRLKPSPN